MRASLTFEKAALVFDTILTAPVPPEQLAGLLVGFEVKGITVEELFGALTSVMKHQVTIAGSFANAVDLGGTGGDRGRTFNISTVASLVVAAARVQVIKHGAGAASGTCGSLDLIRCLGINVGRDQQEILEALNSAGIAFVDSRDFLQYPPVVFEARRALGIRTIFNCIGPWCNPCRVSRQLIGVGTERDFETFLGVARKLEKRQLMLIHGLDDASDEFSISGRTRMAVFRDGDFVVSEVRPEDFGLSSAQPETVSGGSREFHTARALAILEGTETGPGRSVVLMTAAAALQLAGKAMNLQDGVRVAKSVLESGEAARLVRRLRSSPAAVECNQPRRDDLFTR